MTDVLLRAIASRWVSGDFPGWIEVVVEDAEGRAHRIIEKVSVLVSYELDADSVFPRELWLRGAMEQVGAGGVTITLGAGVETVDGLRRLTVQADDVRWL